MTQRAVHRVLNIFLALLFLSGAAVQYNDPDPFGWIAIYVAAGAACAFAAMGRLRWPFPAVTALVASIWAITLAPRVLPNARISEMFSTWEMSNNRIEECRELFGLVIIFLCMSALALANRRTRNSQAPETWF